MGAVGAAPHYARLRQFTDLRDPFIKRVALVDGDGATVTIGGDHAAQRAERDSLGRALPTWTGCRTLRGEVFLLGDTADSFDGRCWGPTALVRIEGVWPRL